MTWLCHICGWWNLSKDRTDCTGCRVVFGTQEATIATPPERGFAQVEQALITFVDGGTDDPST